MSGATASSRSKMKPSAASDRAFSRARGLEPGTNKTLRRGRKGGPIGILRSPTLSRYNLPVADWQACDQARGIGDAAIECGAGGDRARLLRLDRLLGAARRARGPG